MCAPHEPSGACGGTIDGSDGVFRVTGSHAYAAKGIYSVGVTITDTDGFQGMASGTVTAGDFYAGVTQTLTVGSFTNADPNATAGNFTATIDWGDGGGIWEALGSHVYASLGQYAVKTLLTNAAGTLAAAVSLVEADAPTTPEIVGPAVVPGNSIYRYVVNIPDTPANQFVDYPGGASWGRFTVTASNGTAATKVFDGHAYNPANGNFKQLIVDVQFANMAGYVAIKLPAANWVKGSTEV